MRVRSGGARDERPLVLAEQAGGAMRLAGVDRRAHKLGLAPGLALADARARIPDLMVAENDPAADEALIRQIAEDSDRWTPLVALDPPHGLILDITGCSHLFGGEAALQTRLCQRLGRARLTVRSAIAGTPEAARAMARFGQTRIVPVGEEAAHIQHLPVAALELIDETLTALKRAGLQRIGDLASRSGAPLAARFGEDLNVMLRRLMGFEDRRITPLRTPPACLVEQPFAEPIARSDDIERSLERLIIRASAVLEARGDGGRAFEASFFRTDGQVRRIKVETGRPLRDSASILRLFREKLDALADPLDPGFGFDLIRLSVPATEPFSNMQPSLDGKALEEDELAGLIDRLVARFGPARVLRFAAADTHDPVRAAQLVPATADVRDKCPWPVQEPGEPPLRPLRLFDPPQPIETLAEVPDGPPLRFRWRRVLHQVARAEGPERIASEWWRDQDVPTRDYYRVEDEAGRRFWLFRAGLYDREAHEPRWYLHGLFA